MTSDVKEKRDSAVAVIEKAHGKEAVAPIEQNVGKIVPHIPTGIYTLDHNVLGIGGFPRGRIVECYGPESSGKTSLALTTVSSVQKLGYLAGYIDVEHALQPDWAALLGVDVDAMVTSQPNSGEEAWSIAETMIDTGNFGIVVIDSIAAMTPQKEIDGDFGDSNMGLMPRLMGQAMRKLAGKVDKTKTILFALNQTRTNLGVTYGSNVVTPGGKALRFYASVRLELARIASLKEGESVYGNKVRIKAVKNKVAAPFRQTEVEFLFDEGFDKLGNFIDVCILEGLIQKAGSWYSYAGEKLGQGKDAVKQFLKDNNKAHKELEKSINAIHNKA